MGGEAMGDYGQWFYCVSCGVSDENRMWGSLRAKSSTCWSWSTYFWSLYRSWHCAHCPLRSSPWNQNPVKQRLKILPPQFQNSPLITSHHVGLIFSLTAVDIFVSLTAVDKMSCMMPQDHSDVYADKLLVRSYVLSKGYFLRHTLRRN